MVVYSHIMKVLVTGGAGFIGSHSAEALLAAGHSVRVFDNLSTGALAHVHAAGAVELVEGDVRNAEALRFAVEGCDAILHLAALVSVPLSIQKPLETFEINTRGTAHVLEAARLSPRPPRVVIASTSAVYGDIPGRKDEHAPLKPLAPYAASKLMAEHLCESYTRSFGIETLCLRYFNVYGPRQRADSPYSGVLAKWTSAIASQQPCLVYGDGENTRDFVNVRDVAEANLCALLLPLPASRVLNVATGHSVSLNTLLASLARSAGTALDIRYQPAREGDIVHSAADSGALQAAFGWQARISLDEGLRSLLG
jgi:UDP-glucose 4-epimerase